MSIAQRWGADTTSFETSARLEEFWRGVRYLMQVETGQFLNNEKSARAAGLSERGIEYVTKAAVPAGTTTDATFASPLAPRSLASAFVSSLIGQSVFDTLRGSTVAVPPLSSVTAVTTAFSGSTIAEGNAKPLSRLSIGANSLDPVKAIGMTAISSEVVKMGGSLAENLIRRELTNATVRATDQQFLALIGAGALAIPSSGQTMSAIKSDISQLLQNVPTGASSRLFLVTTSVTAKAWSVTPDAGAQPGFSSMTYAGGQVAGIEVIVSDVVAPGEVWLIDASQLATATDGDVRISATRQASINMADAPDSPPSAATNMVSLWQMNLVGVMAERVFGAKALRSTAVAKITGAFYSGSSPS